MVSTVTTRNLRLERMAKGENDGTWGGKTNNNLKWIEEGIVGVNALTITGDRTLTSLDFQDDESRFMTLEFSGTLTADATITLPSKQATHIIRNNTTGGFNLVISAGSGSNVTVDNGNVNIIYTDGSNVRLVADNEIDSVVSLTVGSSSVPNLTFTGSDLDVTSPRHIDLNVSTSSGSLSIKDSNGTIGRIARPFGQTTRGEMFFADVSIEFLQEDFQFKRGGVNWIKLSELISRIEALENAG